MSVMINKNLKAGNVLPPLQVLIHCLDEPSQIGGKEKQLLELQEKLSVLLTTEGKEEKPLKVDDICSSYLPKTGEFTNGVTPRYDSFFYNIYCFTLHDYAFCVCVPVYSNGLCSIFNHGS